MARKKLRVKRLLPFLIVGVAVVVAAVVLFWPNHKNSQASSGNCSIQSTDFECWTKHYQNIVDTQSTKAAYEDLKAKYPKSQYIQSECHQLTHVIGRREAEKSKDVADAYTKGDNFCWSGYYHGVIESFATRYGEQKFVQTLNDICKGLREAKRYSFYHYNCVHGLGHGVMAVRNDELFIALGDCDTITDQWERTSCYGGVFMENIMSNPAVNKAHTTKYLKNDQPMYPCTAVADQYKEQCYLMQTSYALTVINYDFAKVFDLCASIEEAHQDTCYQSVGRDASGNSVSDVQITNQKCNLGKTDEQIENCAIGAVKDFISYYHDDSKAKELCLSFTQPSVQQTCQRVAAEYYQSF